MKYYVRLDGEEIELEIVDRGDQTVVVTEDGETPVELCPIRDGGSFSLLVGQESLPLVVTGEGNDLTLIVGSETWAAHVLDARERAAEAVGGDSGSRGAGLLRAVMPGIVREVRVAAGDGVAVGDPLLILEAMKMQNEIRSEYDGVVLRLHVEAGTAVAKGDPLIELGEAPDA